MAASTNPLQQPVSSPPPPISNCHLTTKQQHFVDLVKSGTEALAAYHLAYVPNPQLHSGVIRQSLDRLLKSKAVRQALVGVLVKRAKHKPTEPPPVKTSSPAAESAATKPTEPKPKALTAKQSKFLELYAQGKTKLDAFRIAYDAADSTPGAVAKGVYDICQSPSVAPILKSIDDKRRNVIESVLPSPEEARQFLTAQLLDMSKTEKGSVKLRAIELYGKVRGVRLFEDEVHHVHDIGNNMAGLIAGLLASLPQTVVRQVLPPARAAIEAMFVDDSKEPATPEVGTASPIDENDDPTVPQAPL